MKKYITYDERQDLYLDVFKAESEKEARDKAYKCWQKRTGDNKYIVYEITISKRCFLGM